MGAKNNDEDGKLSPSETEELLKDAAEGLRQVPGQNDAVDDAEAESETLPGIPLDALHPTVFATTQKIRPRPIEAEHPGDGEDALSEADLEASEAETIPPGQMSDAPFTTLRPIDEGPPIDRKIAPPDAETVLSRPRHPEDEREDDD